MDVDSFGKGGQKSGKKVMARTAGREQNPIPNKEVVRWHSGKKGHFSTECWSSPETLSGSGGGQHKGGKGETENGTGKGAGSLEQRDQAATVEQQPQLDFASSLDLASFETPGRSPHLDPEGWLRWTYDTGAAISAFPLDAKTGTATEANECSYTTASAELIPNHGGLCVQGTTEDGCGVTFRVRKADVHKTLISAS